MNINTALQEAKQHIDRLDAEVLLAHVLEKDRGYLRAWPEDSIDDKQLNRFQQLFTRRAAGEPLAYLTGWKEFWSLQLRVSPATLIPRPDTELLVEEALKKIPHNADWSIADLGTGSGAIALAIASERPQCQITATDISHEALQIAQDNAHQLGMNTLRFIEGDWASAFDHSEKFEMIIANPPYIDADDDHLQQDGLPFEPIQALSPGTNGLTAIHSIIQQARTYLSPPGWLLLEHGYNQGDQVRTLLTQQGFESVSTLLDLNHKPRLSLGQLKS